MASPQQAIQRRHAALEPLEVEVLIEDSESLIADESAGSGYRNQALIEGHCQTEDGQTVCELTASNLGVVPMQDDHCKGVLGVLAEAIRDFSLERGPSYAFDRLMILWNVVELSIDPPSGPLQQKFPSPHSPLTSLESPPYPGLFLS